MADGDPVTTDATGPGGEGFPDPADATADDPATVETPDGRTLAYAEYGDPEGDPVLCFHGAPGSRTLWRAFDPPAREAGVRVVAPDRPGFGHSEFQPGRSIRDWAGDVEFLADHLGLDRFGVVGFSAGGPHALAVADADPERLTGTVLVSTPPPSGVGPAPAPGERLLVGATRFVPGFSRLLFGITAWLRTRRRSTFEDAVFGGVSEPDRELLAGPLGDVLRDDAVESFRHGGRGIAHEFPLVGGSWGVDPRGVTAPVSVWHGREDATVALPRARALADALPEGEIEVVDGGHYSTLLDNRAAVLLNATG